MLKGSIVALVTPFEKSGKIDLQTLKKLLNWHREAGTEGLVLCGTTGEGSALSREEKCLIFQTAVEMVGGCVYLIAATGTHVTEESIFFTQEAKKIGVDACMAIVPYYLRPTFEGCLQHFTKIANVGLPMILYHHPGRTGIKLKAEELIRICSLPNIIGVKDATGDLHLAMEMVDQIPHFSGDDFLALPQLSMGFVGSISIVGNILPTEWKTFVHFALEGDLKEARNAFFVVRDLCKAMVIETNPQCVKYAMSLLGLCSSKMRLPLVEPSKEAQEKIKMHAPIAGSV